MGQKIQKDKKSPQKGLFDINIEKELEIIPNMPELDELDEQTILKFEKEILGFYLFGNPLDIYSDILKEFTTQDTETISTAMPGNVERIGGIITNVKTILTKKGNQMAFILLEDFKGTIEITVFNSVYMTSRDLLQKDTPVIVQGKIQKDQNSIKMLAETIRPIKKAKMLTSSIYFKINNERVNKKKLIKLKKLLECYPGKNEVFLKINIAKIAVATISLPESLKIRPCLELTSDVEKLFGYNPMIIRTN